MTANPSPLPATAWRYIHPDHRRSLIERVAGDRVQVEDEGVEVESDAALLLEHGCCGSLVQKDGEPRLQVHFEDLVTAEAYEPLRSFFAKARPRGIPVVPRGHPAGAEYLIWAHLPLDARRGDPLAILQFQVARALLESRVATRVGERELVVAILLLSRFHGDGSAARHLLGTRGSILKPASAAKLWHVLGDDAMARQILESNVPASDRDELLAAAEVWRMIGDGDAARRCLERAADAAAKSEFPPDSVKVAEARLRLFHDGGQARACLDRATSTIVDRLRGVEGNVLTSSITEATTVAVSWMNLFGEAAKARGLLATATHAGFAFAETLSERRGLISKAYAGVAKQELLFVAYSWRHLFHDSSEVRRIVAWMDAHVRDADDALSDRMQLAQVWKQVLEDDAEARRQQELAGRLARNASDRLAVAARWHTMLGDARRSRWQLRRAQWSAKSMSDWLGLARHWWKYDYDATRARRSLESAQARASDARDWYTLAEAWDEVVADATSVELSLQRAELDANTPGDWSEIAGRWWSLRQSRANAHRCLREAEEMVRGWPVSDLYRIALEWKRVREDDEGRRCLRDGEVHLEGAEDWRRMAEVWRDLFDDEEAARRCLGRANDVERAAS